jgi:hypothetical protein
MSDTTAFLRKSRRSLFYALRIRQDQPGSVPHSKLGRTPLFVPDDLRQWASMGFPPLSAFKTWKEAEMKKKEKCLTF